MEQTAFRCNLRDLINPDMALREIVRRVNAEGWKVDQVVITQFDPFAKPPHGTGLVASEAVLLCSK